jgi:DNA-binding NarL/FixJ family response regulator
LAGETFVSPLVKGQIGDNRPLEEIIDRPGVLRPSERQLEILLMLREGATHREIADSLDISTKTVEYHLDFLRRRVGIANIALLIRWAEGFEEKRAPKRSHPRRRQGS